MKNRRIAVLAPVEPFRGGIAKHSTQISLSLSQNSDVAVKTLSFSRLYPKILFPGERDKDGSEGNKDLPVSFILDTVNPLTWFRVIKEISSFKANAIIVPAWTFFVAPCFGFIASACRKKGIPTIAIVHNAFDHEQGGWKNALMKYQLSKCAAYVCHNDAIKRDIVHQFPNARVEVSPHPIFDQYPPAKGVLTRRAKREFLFFGLIREYKGLDILLRAIAQLKDVDWHLSIVGECWGDIAEYEALAEKLGIAQNVEFVPRYVSDEEAAEYFFRADCVVLPYRSMTGTGVIPLAYHYNTPVVTTNLDAFHQVVTHGKSGLIAEGVDEESLTASLQQFAEMQCYQHMQAATRELVKLFTWDNFCQILVNACIKEEVDHAN